MASQAAPPEGEFKEANATQSVARSPSASSQRPKGNDEGGIRPVDADYDTETVERVYRYAFPAHHETT